LGSALGSKERVAFVFDNEKMEPEKVRAEWGKFIELAPPGIKEIVAGLPGFENDQKLTALQAAVFEAGWILP
jgi:hypothetical protein